MDTTNEARERIALAVEALDAIERDDCGPVRMVEPAELRRRARARLAEAAELLS